jgi:FAD/FMN-containing dehydrogenase
MNQLLSDLSEAFGPKAYLPNDEKYNESIESYFSNQEKSIKPSCILFPKDTSDVAGAVSLLAKANSHAGTGSLKFAVRSGGHACFAGSANIDGGVTIDLRGLNTIEVASDSTKVTAGPGVTWGELYRTLEPLGLAVAGGRQSSVGVGGLTLGGT